MRTTPRLPLEMVRKQHAIACYLANFAGVQVRGTRSLPARARVCQRGLASVREVALSKHAIVGALVAKAAPEEVRAPVPEAVAVG
eukprot:3556877-Alexandrium_andersonii.AAC.1